jgi:predicted transcriptional regulator
MQNVCSTIMALKTTVYLNDQLERLLQTYLAEHPDATLSNLIQDALESKLNRANAAAELLKITGIAQNAPPTDDHNREQIF